MNKPRVPRTDRATTVWMCAAAVAAAITTLATTSQLALFRASSNFFSPMFFPTITSVADDAP